MNSYSVFKRVISQVTIIKHRKENLEQDLDEFLPCTKNWNRMTKYSFTYNKNHLPPCYSTPYLHLSTHFLDTCSISKPVTHSFVAFSASSDLLHPSHRAKQKLQQVLNTFQHALQTRNWKSIFLYTYDITRFPIHFATGKYFSTALELYPQPLHDTYLFTFRFHLNTTTFQHHPTGKASNSWARQHFVQQNCRKCLQQW